MYSYFWLTVVLLALPAFGAPGATEELRPPATAALAEASVQLGGRPPSSHDGTQSGLVWGRSLSAMLATE